jgi:hypothetical protein
MLNITKTQFKISTICLFCTLLFSTILVARVSTDKRQINVELSVDKLTFDFTWAKGYLKKYPELGWFTNQSFLGRKVATDPLNFTHSEIFRKEYNAYEKIIFMLYHLRLFIDCDYSEFQKMALFQDSSLKLEFSAFHKIKKEILESLSFREGVYGKKLCNLLELTLIYSQIHLSQKAQDKAFIYEIQVQENESFFLNIQNRCPSFFPSFDMLNKGEKELLMKLLDFHKLDTLFCVDFHKRESAAFKEHNLYASDENLFDLIFFLYRCYCPSTHLFSLKGSLFYHQKMHSFLDDLKKSYLVMQSSGSRAGIEHYIRTKRESFSIDKTSIIDLVLEPIFYKLYFLDKNEALALKRAVTDLKSEDLSLFITYLKDDCFESTTFITNVIQTLFQQNQGADLTDVFKDSLDLFVRVISFLEEDSNIKGSVKALDDSHLIKALRMDSTKLMAMDISIDHRGTIRVANN